MAKFTARIGLKFKLPTSTTHKSATYLRLHKVMATLGFTRPPQPTGEYINRNGPDSRSAAQMARAIKALVDEIHKPNSGVVEKGEIAEW